MDEEYVSPELGRLGQIIWLCMNSDFHSQWRLALFVNNLIPPIQFNQFHLIFEKNRPVAYSSWAFFSEEAEFRYILNPTAIRRSDWHSGDRMWFIDFISPFSQCYTIMMKRWLAEQFPNRYARALRVRLNSDTGSIRTFFNRNTTLAMRKQANDEILAHFADKVAPENSL